MDQYNLSIDVTLRLEGHVHRIVLNGGTSYAKPSWFTLREEDGQVAAFQPLPTLEKAVEVRAGLDSLIERYRAEGWTRDPDVEPPDPFVGDLRIAVESLMEVMQQHREQFPAKARAQYERFRCEMEVAGFGVHSYAALDRAARQRRMGELAEHRGDVSAAIWHYQQAVKAHAAVGVKRRLEALIARHRPASLWPPTES